MSKLFWRLKRRLFDLFRDNYPFRDILEKENENFRQLIEKADIKGKTVLDLGVGTGNVLFFLDSASKSYGLDFTESMLKQAKERFPEAGYVKAKAQSLPFKSNSLDVITAVGLVEYVKDIIPIVEESCRVLKKDGYFLLTFSPKNIWTRLRVLLGHPVYARKLGQLESVIKFCHFEVCECMESMMQNQVLLKKSVNCEND